MSGELFFPGVNHDRLAVACERIDFLSEQSNYLLRELYKATQGQHGAFQRNPSLAEEVKRAVALEAEGKKQVKVTVATPDFTAEQMKRLEAEKNK